MTAIAFDTLAYSNRLQKSGVPKDQADAMAEANADALGNIISMQELVTKKDMVIALNETKHEILKWMVTAMIAQTALLVGIIAFLK